MALKFLAGLFVYWVVAVIVILAASAMTSLSGSSAIGHLIAFVLGTVFVVIAIELRNR
jgi:hypothetical protein